MDYSQYVICCPIMLNTLKSINIAIAFINVCTMVPVNVIVRERDGPPSPTKYVIDWSIVANLPFALMAAGMYNWTFYTV